LMRRINRNVTALNVEDSASLASFSWPITESGRPGRRSWPRFEGKKAGYHHYRSRQDAQASHLDPISGTLDFRVRVAALNSEHGSHLFCQVGILEMRFNKSFEGAPHHDSIGQGGHGPHLVGRGNTEPHTNWNPVGASPKGSRHTGNLLKVQPAASRHPRHGYQVQEPGSRPGNGLHALRGVVGAQSRMRHRSFPGHLEVISSDSSGGRSTTSNPSAPAVRASPYRRSAP